MDELNPAVDDRRHSDVPHMPIAISLRHLRATIVQRLETKYPDDESKHIYPSLEWIRLQFWPPDPYATSALRHTAQLNLKFGVQVRQLRHTHPDSRYVSVLLRYIKEFCAKFRSSVHYLSVDDKAIIPVGEPGLPVSTGVRGHNRSIVPVQGNGPMALDHDFHLHGVVPSVLFSIDIPQSAHESFYRGKVFVTLKDKATQPSSPLRHSCEITSVVQTNFSQDGSRSNKPVMVIVSDGGPDHIVTYMSVKLSMIALFQALDMDILVNLCKNLPISKLAECSRKGHVDTEPCSYERIFEQIGPSWRL